MRIFIFKLFLFLILLNTAYSNDDHLTKEEKALILNASTGAALIAWGVANWDYSLSADIHAKSEGWIGKNTKEGGADKFGHLYSAYFASHMFSYVYEDWGYNKDDAVLYGTMSSLGFTSLIELGDAFSPYGFSHEDFISNIAGALFGYYTYKYPSVSEKIDLRVEYKFHKESFKGDIMTDYNNMKYLIALKADGFELFKDNPYLKYMELHVGYYARGYDNHIQDDDRRYSYIGIGINLAKIFDSKIFNYFQMPYTYIEHKNQQ